MKKGFTITELLAVIAIIAILSIAAISEYTAMTKNSKKKSYDQKVSQIEIAAEKYASETNMKETTTISVNKLVVMGYIQPDTSSEDGLAFINNPINNDNMVCGLVTIEIKGDDVQARFSDDDKNCNIANIDKEDTKITVTGYNYNRSSDTVLGYENNTKKLNWAGDSLLVYVTSDYFNDPNFYSVIYNYGGNDVEKLSTGGKTNSASRNGVQNYNSAKYNELLITKEDVGLLFSSELNIIITFKDGTTKGKTIIARMDFEPPTGYAVISNKYNTNSEREVDLFLEDGIGSGVEGYAYTTNSSDNPKNLNYGTIENVKILNENNGKFYINVNGRYYVYAKDKVGNISNAILVDSSNMEVDKDSITCGITTYSPSSNIAIDYSDGEEQ